MTDSISFTALPHVDVAAQNEAEEALPHEDLTIREFLKIIQAEAGAKHPGKNGYHREKGKVQWIDKKAADKFLAKHGTKHPSNYRQKYSRHWEDDFFATALSPRILGVKKPTIKTIASGVGMNLETILLKSKVTYASMSDEANDLLRSTTESFRKNPIQWIATVFAFGLTIGFFGIPPNLKIRQTNVKKTE